MPKVHQEMCKISKSIGKAVLPSQIKKRMSRAESRQCGMLPDAILPLVYYLNTDLTHNLALRQAKLLSNRLYSLFPLLTGIGCPVFRTGEGFLYVCSFCERPLNYLKILGPLPRPSPLADAPGEGRIEYIPII